MRECGIDDVDMHNQAQIHQALKQLHEELFL
jgi:hypothetical protein